MNIWKNKKWKPMLLKEVDEPFDSKEFLYELKLDGIRALVFATPEKVYIQTRNMQDITNLYPELQKIKNIVTEETIFDGEIVAFQNNIPSFQKLQERNHLKNPERIKNQSRENPIVFMCFDVIYIGKDITNLNLLERKKLLKKFKNNDVFVKNKSVNDKGISFFKNVKKLGLEGIVAKRKNSLYDINTRTYNWLKIKNLKSDNFVIGGYIDTLKNNMISLLLGEYRHNKLYFTGKVTMNKKNNLYKKIKKLKVMKKTPFIDYSKEVKYINPSLKCYVKYLERTKNNHLRQPIFIKEI